MIIIVLLLFDNYSRWTTIILDLGRGVRAVITIFLSPMESQVNMHKGIMTFLAMMCGHAVLLHPFATWTLFMDQRYLLHIQQCETMPQRYFCIYKNVKSCISCNCREMEHKWTLMPCK